MFDPQTTRPVAAMAVLLGQPETSNVTMLQCCFMKPPYSSIHQQFQIFLG